MPHVQSRTRKQLPVVERESPLKIDMLIKITFFLGHWCIVYSTITAK
jgi:hypothetical protein